MMRDQQRLHLHFLTFVLLFFVTRTFGAQYCAQISGLESYGASGYFAMDIINPGKAQYWYNIDLRQVSSKNLTCDVSKGLYYRLSANWTRTTNSALGPFACGSSTTGTPYDPNLACSAGRNNPQCVALKRTPPDLFFYSCNPNTYVNQYGSCDVGDLSGKFGAAMQTVIMSLPGASIKINTFVSNANLIDYQPPYESQYMNPSAYHNIWSSLVVGCRADNSILLCAKLLQIPPNTYSMCGFPATGVKYYSANDSTLLKLNAEQTAICVIAIIFFIYLAITVYFFISRRCFTSPTDVAADARFFLEVSEIRKQFHAEPNTTSVHNSQGQSKPAFTIYANQKDEFQHAPFVEYLDDRQNQLPRGTGGRNQTAVSGNSKQPPQSQQPPPTMGVSTLPLPPPPHPPTQVDILNALMESRNNSRNNSRTPSIASSTARKKKERTMATANATTAAATAGGHPNIA